MKPRLPETGASRRHNRPRYFGLGIRGSHPAYPVRIDPSQGVVGKLGAPEWSNPLRVSH